MIKYLNDLRNIMENGSFKDDRTGTGTVSLFGLQTRYDISQRFPLLTTKKMFLKGVIHELLWFLKGSTNTKYLNDNGVHIWDEWANEDGNLGPIYGHQWRSWPGHNGDSIDQIHNVIESLRSDPNGRRHIVNAWNVSDLNHMALPPCHLLFQFYVRDNTWLDCQLYQRSADMLLGVPFNIASYALLTMMVAQQIGLSAGHFVHTIGDAHIYTNHFTQVRTQLSREVYDRPVMRIRRRENIDLYTHDDFELIGYEHHPAIKAPIAV